MIDIEQFLEKEIKRKKEQELKLDFLADIELTLNKIKDKVNSSPIEKINSYYKEVLGFEKEIKGKFLSIESTTYQVLNTLVYDFYEKKYIEDVKLFNKKKQLFEIKIRNIEDNLEKRDIKKALNSYTEAINILNNYPEGFFEERFKDLRRIGKLYEKLSKYIKIDIEKTKEDILIKFKKYLYEIVSSLKEKDYLKLEKEILNLEGLITEIPKSLSTDFLPYEEKANELLIIAKDILFKYYRNRFEYLEGEIKENITRFKEYSKNDNLKDGFLTYNVILNLFKRLPDFFLEKKKVLFEEIVDLYSELNTLILKENVLFFSNQEKIGFLLSNFEEYYYLINLNQKYYSKEKVSKIIRILKKMNSDYSNLLLKKFEKFIEKNKLIKEHNEINKNKDDKEKKTEQEEKILKILLIKKLIYKLNKINNIEKFKKEVEITKKNIMKLEISTHVKNSLLEELEDKIEHKKKEMQTVRKLKTNQELEGIKQEIKTIAEKNIYNINEINVEIKKLITKTKLSDLDIDIKKKILKLIQEIYIKKAVKNIIIEKPDIKKIILLYEELLKETDKNNKKNYIKMISLLSSKLKLSENEKEYLKEYFLILKKESKN